MFIPKLVEIYPVVLEKILDFVNEFPLFRLISPLKSASQQSEQTWIPFTQGYFVPRLVEIGEKIL